MTTRNRRIAAAVLVVAVIAAIFVFRGRGTGKSATRAPASTAGSTTTSTPPTSPSLQAMQLTLTRIATVQQPTAISSRPNDASLYVVEQPGRVRRLVRSGDTFSLDATPFLDISGDVRSGGEQGMLGIAFTADGQHMYIAYTNRGADQQLDEFALQGDRVVEGSRRTLLVVPDFAPNHNGGDLVLGRDGYLYYTMGDGGGAGDPRNSGQDPHDLLGDILRIDPTKPAGGKAYGIPPGNPFADGQAGAPEVFAYGLRNPWRMSFDRKTNDLWIGDVGQGKIEEVDFVPAGSPAGLNFGWSSVEGDQPFNGDGPPAGSVLPIYEYDHGGGRCSITGGFVYRGAKIPTLDGTYLFGDNCVGDIQGLVRAADGSVTVTGLGLHVEGLSSFGEDNDGEMYAVGVADGSVSRIDAVTAGGSAAPPPTTAPAATLSADPATAADQLAAAEAVLRDPAATADALASAAHVQQLAYRRLGRQPELYDMVVSRAPDALRDAIRLNLDARHELGLIPGGPLRDTLPAWRINQPAPEVDLFAFYREGEAQFGVGWNYLAAINLVESAMGRIEGLSSAGAQGPMQFMPATWDGYGAGGDINSPHDSIVAAARYLHANGFADGNVDGSLYRYNNSEHYVNAIKDLAAVLAADPRAYAGYYRWEVFYVTTVGDVRLPVGFETAERISAADYIAAHPQEP